MFTFSDAGIVVFKVDAVAKTYSLILENVIVPAFWLLAFTSKLVAVKDAAAA